ncbi:MAG: RDD family protein [Holophagales bacterium]|nr:RDD family protein [Holophagales bacterium]
MSRRRSKGEPEPPLFDLPLHGEAEPDPGRSYGGPEPAEPESADPGSTSAAEADPGPAPIPPAATGEMGLLFDPDHLAPSGSGAAEAGPGIAGPSPFRADEPPFDPEMGGEIIGESEAAPAPVQDRILGGVADLTVHVATLGAMVIAVQLMGARVSLDSLPGFAALGLVFSFLYTVIPLAFWGQTPGMAWVGHASRSMGGEPLTFGQTFLRWLGALFTVALAGLPVLLAFLGGRSLCDRLSDSRTVQL